MSERPGRDRPDSERPGHDKPGDSGRDRPKPPHDGPGQGKPPHDRPDHDKPPHGRPDHDKPPHDRPDHDKPPHDRPDHDKPPHDRPDDDTGRVEYTVTGLVASPERGGEPGAAVAIVDRNVGEDVQVASATTDARGWYAVTFKLKLDAACQRHKDLPDLQAQVRSDEKTVAASEVRYDASPNERIDVVLPAASVGLPNEHDALIAALGEHFDGDLGDLAEDDERHDITYLANKSGWDARAVALATLSTQLADQAMDLAARGNGRTRAAAMPGEAMLQPAHYYALMRAGVGADPDSVYGLAAETAVGVWERAIDDGVISDNLAGGLEQVAKTFADVSATHALDARAVPGAATLSDMLSLSLGEDRERQRAFAGLVVTNRESPERLWDDVKDSFGEPLADRLRLDGQLALLTIDNAPLMSRVHEATAGELSSPAELALHGFHDPEQWRPLVGEDIPEQIPGADTATRAANYADLLAAQVRLMSPTGVVADLVGKGTIELSPDSDIQGGVHSFLADHARDFSIGVEPLARYVARTEVDVSPPVREQIQRLQRVYQITPDDQAISTLLARGLDSAAAVTRYGTEALVADLGETLGGETVARSLAEKAQQVHHAVLNIVGSYLTTRMAPAVGSDPAALIVDPTITQSDEGIAPAGSATLETLFGSMDYCRCQHCRSVLSPAAYLVDLLLFADRPFGALENPLTVLLERRPDLQHLQLTCENTNTALPYIDIVIETLEHFVVSGLSLADYHGHDTGPDDRTEDLLASAQFVQTQAYATLQAERFPPPLPFHRPLELLRRHFSALDVPLATALERLRAGDAVDRSASDAYGWRDILMERLEISRPEHVLLTDGSFALADLYGFPPGTTEDAALAELTNGAALARRLAVTPDELVALIRTRFINPGAELIPKLERLGVTFATLVAVHDGTVSDEELEPHLPSGVTAADVHAFVEQHYDRAAALILLATDGDGDPCSLADCSLQHADTSALAPIDFVHLARVTRLWRKLGWTVDRTDDAITALWPDSDGDGEDDDGLPTLDAGFRQLIDRLGVVRDVMDRLKLSARSDLPELLACFAPIGHTGQDSLYARLFLGAAFLGADPAFAPTADGSVLQDPTQTVGGHAEALQAAAGLTAADLALIVERLAGGTGAPLTLENVSDVYRHAWLSRRLKVSVRELLALIDHTGLDPFAPPDPPAPPIAALLDHLDALRGMRLKPSQALYLAFDDDLTDTADPDDATVHALARTLRASLAQIETQFTIVDDPDGDIARSRAALVYGPEAADTLFALLGGRFSVSVEYSHTAETLPEAVLAAAVGRLSYDDVRKRLSYAGVLAPETVAALTSVPGVSAAFQAAVTALDAAGHEQTDAFFARYPELRSAFESFIGSSEPDLVKRRAAVLAAFLPTLERRRKSQQAVGELVAALRADAATAELLATDATVLHAAADAESPAVVDLTAVQTQGLDARLYWSATVGSTPDSVPAPLPTVDYSPDPGGTPVPHGPDGAAAVSGVWSGNLVADESGEFALAVDTDAASVTLALGDVAIPLTQVGQRWRTQVPLTLVAGELVAVAITVQGVTERLRLLWQSAGRGWQTIPGRQLYPATVIDRLRTTYVRMLKAASLAKAGRLTPAELAHLARDPDLFVDGAGWLNALRLTAPPAAGTDAERLAALDGLLTFARLKAELSPEDERLLAVLKDPAATAPDGGSPLLTLTGWSDAGLDALLAHMGHTRADLVHLDVFARVRDAEDVVSRLGTPVTAALAAATNDPTEAVTAAFQASLRARYHERDWLEVLRPINDELRRLQRDALLAYVLRRLAETPATTHIDTPDRLYEHFLMDVQMEPCMRTSRIRHALSSVQLFLERCLMNLEPRVAPSSIIAAEWEWMKRYRVWEANRKVFLWPENWLEPELRDDQSPLFKEALSDLLQGDVTEDRAASAIRNYLVKLEEIARLEPSGIFIAEGEPGTADDVVHVVARTPGAHRKYYYRRNEAASWSPWERVELDIEDDPVMPVVWRGRLFLFWLRIVKQAPDASRQPRTSSGGATAVAGLTLGTVKSDLAEDAKTTAKSTVKAVLSYSEYVDGKWQPVKTSNPDLPTELGEFFSSGQGAFDRLSLQLATRGETGELTVKITGPGSSSFQLYNTHSAPVRSEDIPVTGFFDIFLGRPANRSITTPANRLTIRYDKANAWIVRSPTSPLLRDVIDGTLPIAVVAPHQTLSDQWLAPFLVADARHCFYVETTSEAVTIVDYGGFGVGTGSPTKTIPKLPPIVWQEVPDLKPKPDPWISLVAGAGTGVTDPSPILRGVSEDAFITRAINTLGTVRIGEKLIGPKGAIRISDLGGFGGETP